MKAAARSGVAFLAGVFGAGEATGATLRSMVLMHEGSTVVGRVAFHASASCVRRATISG